MSKKISLIECPRDAMQGWKEWIPTATKAAYINSLLKVGFDTIDFGSFVSPKAIPQMADTKDVLKQLNLQDTQTKLLAIVANEKGAHDALAFEGINYLGYPFSISETFQQRNSNASINESVKRVEEIQQLCVRSGRQLVVYISMAFGNPYGDPYQADIVLQWAKQLYQLGITTISLADTVGLATAPLVETITRDVIEALPGVNVGVHLHSAKSNWQVKANAALAAGCLRFDGALNGIGGCPMANDELVGNMDTALMIPFFESKNLLPALNEVALAESLQMAAKIFNA